MIKLILMMVLCAIPVGILLALIWEGAEYLEEQRKRKDNS